MCTYQIRKRHRSLVQYIFLPGATITFYRSLGSGALEFPEFLKLMCKPAPPRKKTEEEELKECFDYFDKDGSGTISLYEMRQTMFEIAAQIGEELSLEEVQESHFMLCGFLKSKCPDDVYRLCIFSWITWSSVFKCRTGVTNCFYSFGQSSKGRFLHRFNYVACTVVVYFNLLCLSCF